MPNSSNNISYHSEARRNMRAMMIQDTGAKLTPINSAVLQSSKNDETKQELLGLVKEYQEVVNTTLRTARNMDSFEKHKVSLRAAIIEKYNAILSLNITFSKAEEKSCAEIIKENKNNHH